VRQRYSPNRLCKPIFALLSALPALGAKISGGF
jgi:hypothetical protein